MDRKLNIYDVDAPIEVSLAGVLERIPGGPDPLPDFDVVGKGFTNVRSSRAEVIKFFRDNPDLGKYELYGTKPDGSKVKVADVVDGQVTKYEEGMYNDLLTPPERLADRIGDQMITPEKVREITSALPSDRAATVRKVLEPYIGKSWREALEIHSRKRP